MFNLLRKQFGTLPGTRPDAWSRRGRNRGHQASGERFQPRLEALETRALPSFIAGPAFAAGIRPNSVAVGDLNGDGQADIVTTNFYQRDSGDFRIIESDVRVFLNSGDGTFQDAQVFQAGTGPLSVAIADFNADGIPDLAVSNGGAAFLPDHTVSILVGNGDGTFLAPQNYDAGAHPYLVAVGDFNGDGIPDLAAVGSGVNSLLGNGDGTFQPPQNYAVAGSFVATGDFNRDGNLDLVTDAGTLLLGNGDGTFQAVQSFSGFARAVAVGDFNADGIPDLALVQASGLNILLGNGDGTFQPAQGYATGSGRSSMVAADFNGDGILDLAVANEFSQTLSVLPGNGDGTFQAAQEYAPGPYPRAVAVADFNGDGFPDLAVANEADTNGVGLGGITILINAADWGGGGGHAALPPGAAQVQPIAHRQLHSDPVPALVEGSPPQTVGTVCVASTGVPPNPAQQWPVPPDSFQTDHAGMNAVPRLLTTTRHARDAAFEHWGNDVREVLAMDL